MEQKRSSSLDSRGSGFKRVHLQGSLQNLSEPLKWEIERDRRDAASNARIFFLSNLVCTGARELGERQVGDGGRVQAGHDIWVVDMSMNN